MVTIFSEIQIGLDVPRDQGKSLPWRISARFDLKPDYAELQGHFPGFPVLPGVTQIKLVREALALHRMDRLGINTAGTLTLKRAIRVKFSGMIRPPASLCIQIDPAEGAGASDGLSVNWQILDAESRAPYARGFCEFEAVKDNQPAVRESPTL